jgi:uncharacterized protein YndB with AHSA1/START domain
VTTRDTTLMETTVAAPLATVWAALHDRNKVPQWFGWDAPSLADEVQMIFGEHATADDASHTLQFGGWEGSADRFELSAEGPGTLLRVVRTGPADRDFVDRFDEVAQGWVCFAQQLRFLAETGKTVPRRTLYLSGKARPGQSPPRGALGLIGDEGARSTLFQPQGEMLSGKVQYRGNFVTALAVSQWGNGLLVVMDRPIEDGRPHGGGSVILSTYGLSDDAFAALEQRWTAWWRERYPGE